MRKNSLQREKTFSCRREKFLTCMKMVRNFSQFLKTHGEKKHLFTYFNC